MASYDALVVVSFGGPEKPADVMPFLENVVRGRGVPRERLLEVEAHYQRFGGVSPINQQCRDLIEALRPELDVPIYWGNRNWHPFLEDTVRQMAADGVRRAAAFATSAYAGYSSCRQYLEDIERARAGVEGAPRIVKLRHFYDHPGFVAAVADHARDALSRLPEEHRRDARLVFTAHSIPLSMAASAGPAGGAYEAQLHKASSLVAAALGRGEHDLVWQSRSGPPQVPWLEPDVCDHLDHLAKEGVRAAVLIPVGFVSDHMEVVYDLDVEAAQRAEELGMHVTRAKSAGTHPRFVRMVRELMEEPEPAPCAATCCPPPARRGAGG
ncbi:ferrochelatase [Thermocatellispora tengchongensis]|uniref:Coproporphyrin III ferrochelatase n=1 Tax=Thermocatellispora tengchongensis TaxID=1073253 RepID=A0A840P247_9ACTN|nr:ferrochelatase [Thermocatellispora tengchongensis]MBB5135354.1 ferrochelatase [Thermocatellispora tengchongensis]